MIDLMDSLELLDVTLYRYFSDDVLFYSIAIAAVIGKLKESSKSNIYSAWIMYFVGTFFHELSHLVVSFFTLGKPTWFSVLPHSSVDDKGNKTIVLGHVKSKNIRWWNVFLISMSPLMLLPFAFWVYDNYFEYTSEGLLSSLVYIFLIVSLLFSSIPSGVDFKNVINSKLIFNLIVPVAVAVGYWQFNEYYSIDMGGLF